MQKEYQLPVILVFGRLMAVIDNSSPNLNFLAHDRPVLESSDFPDSDHPQGGGMNLSTVWSPLQSSHRRLWFLTLRRTQCTGQDDWLVINTDSLRAEIISWLSNRKKFSKTEECKFSQYLPVHGRLTWPLRMKVVISPNSQGSWARFCFFVFCFSSGLANGFITG